MLFLGTVKWTDSLVVDGSVDSNMLYLGKDRYYWAFECVSSGIKMKQGGVLSVICRFHDLIVQRLGDIIRDIGVVRDRAFKNVFEICRLTWHCGVCFIAGVFWKVCDQLMHTSSAILNIIALSTKDRVGNRPIKTVAVSDNFHMKNALFDSCVSWQQMLWYAIICGGDLISCYNCCRHDVFTYKGASHKSLLDIHDIKTGHAPPF